MIFFFCSLFQGVTFKVEAGELTIARILHGGIVDQQGLLHVGDVIKEVRWSEAARPFGICTFDVCVPESGILR